MPFREFVNRSLLLPIVDKFNKTSVLKKRRFLLESQWWDEEKLRAFQLDKLKRLVAHAYEHVPFYRKSFKTKGVTPADIKSLADVEKLPVLRKKFACQKSMSNLKNIWMNILKLMLILNETIKEAERSLFHLNLMKI